ncbi:hypothetical protein BT67DRAFT_439124 [Trichocladium antarcticum]|uniref:Glutamyl-tRNA synthetase n=1 Tax=Trichocladium antarcticum TaxID=1450529 RepID=A0AAN6URK2_9PEZI|nr:hypothetical protein BT67DRAFT_439124 [Trichocladium antarcticum]
MSAESAVRCRELVSASPSQHQHQPRSRITRTRTRTRTRPPKLPKMASLPPLPANYAAALRLIDEAHAADPNTIPRDGATVPYELHYAQQMTRWLAARQPDAPPALQLACRAQHFRRWELPRSSHPPTRAGYLTWRAKQKSTAAAQLTALLTSSAAIQPPLAPAEIARVAALVRKEGLQQQQLLQQEQQRDEETQVLEDVACLVFLDDRLDEFGQRAAMDEDKMVTILRKTWAKMGARGRELARGMALSEAAAALVGKALAGGEV